MAGTMEGEGIATVKASEYAIYSRTVEAALTGRKPQFPTLIMTDNLGNARVTGHKQASSRSRYFLIRYACLHQRIEALDIVVAFVRDPENPSD